MKKTLRNRLEKVTTIIVMIFMAIEILATGTKLFATSLKLFACSLEINYYNGFYIKTDEQTEEIKAVFQQREELYNSDDLIIRYFSQANFIVKLIILALTGYSIYAVLDVAKHVLITAKRKIKKFKSKRKKA